MAYALRQPPPDAPPESIAAPRPALRVADAVALIVGIVVGAGIFRTPSLVAGAAGTESLAMLAWLLGGVVSLIGALCYAELATAYPHAGGDYHYLTRAYGKRFSFLFAWARLSVIQTGSIALLAYVFGDYASQVVRLGPASSPIWAAIAVVALTALNVAGVRQGRRAQNLLTAVEVLGLGLVIVTGLMLAAPAPAAASPGTPASLSSLGLAMVFVLLTYGGWNEAAYVSAEIHDPRRNMARALLWSLFVITALYLLVNWAFIVALGLPAMAKSQTVAADLMQRVLGAAGATVVSLLIAVSAITSANATVFTGARTNYALGRDFPALRFLGHWHPGTRTPVNALLVQGAIALALVVLGALTRKGFETMVEYTAPVFWFFFLLTGIALFVLRRREPHVPRPFRVPGYPVTPLLFCASSLYLLYSSLAYTGRGALVGVAVLGVGVIVLWLVHEPSPQRRMDMIEGGR